MVVKKKAIPQGLSVRLEEKAEESGKTTPQKA
jgi:hypothetical protein